jgi:hypothetical protein
VLEAIVFEEYSAFCKNRFKRLVSGRLVFARNNPKHICKWILREPVPKLVRACKCIGLSSLDKAEIERYRKMNMNQFNI